MLVLTFSTGVIDAVGFLGFDRVFTGNMTGNVVILGMGLAGVDDLPVAGPALALVGFMVGAAIAGRAMRHKAPGSWAVSTTTVFGTVGATVLATAVYVAVVESFSYVATIVITTVLGTAMGLQAAAARVIAVKDVTTVVVTSSITGLAADSWFGARNPGGGARRIAAVVVLLVGAGVGAASVVRNPGLGLLVAAIVILAVALFGALPVREPATNTPATTSVV
ncbi:YoaK family protein [Rhodococcus qingshengii]